MDVRVTGIDSPARDNAFRSLRCEIPLCPKLREDRVVRVSHTVPPAKLKGLYPYARFCKLAPNLPWQSKKSSPAAKPKISRVEVYWHTVQYRTVVLYRLAVHGDCFRRRVHLVFPRCPRACCGKISDVDRRATITAWPRSAARQARFVNLDGKVQVKKVQFGAVGERRLPNHTG